MGLRTILKFLDCLVFNMEWGTARLSKDLQWVKAPVQPPFNCILSNQSVCRVLLLLFRTHMEERTRHCTSVLPFFLHQYLI